MITLDDEKKNFSKRIIEYIFYQGQRRNGKWDGENVETLASHKIASRYLNSSSIYPTAVGIRWINSQPVQISLSH